MVGALVVIRDPAGTVGYASRLANEASLGLHVRGLDRHGSSGPPSRSRRHPSGSSTRSCCGRGARSSSATSHWCTAMRKEGFRNADLWLAFPAEGEEREALYKLTKGEDPDGGGIFDDLGDAVGGRAALRPQPGSPGALLVAREAAAAATASCRTRSRRSCARTRRKVALQEKGGTFTRVALLCLVALGLLGAICLLLYLAIKLVLAGAAGADAAAARAGDAARAGVRRLRPRGVRRLGEAARRRRSPPSSSTRCCSRSSWWRPARSRRSRRLVRRPGCCSSPSGGASCSSARS